MFDEPANDLRAAATVKSVAELTGIGLHTGQDVAIAVHPADAGAGIRFIRTDLERPQTQCIIPADPAYVTRTRLGTVITNSYGVSLSTVEHLMAAFAMMGITDADVRVHGEEIPILDGSARDFIAAIEAVGIAVSPLTIAPVTVSEPLTVNDGESWATIEPLPEGSGAEVILDVTIAFDHEAIGTQQLVIEGDRDTVRLETSDARTFTELRHVEALREIGLARGGSLDNAIVLDEEGVMNADGLRMEREFVRHKVLDLVGDLYLLGAPLGCKITAFKPGHTLNTKLAAAIADLQNGSAMPAVATA